MDLQSKWASLKGRSAAVSEHLDALRNPTSYLSRVRELFATGQLTKTSDWIAVYLQDIFADTSVPESQWADDAMMPSGKKISFYLHLLLQALGQLDQVNDIADILEFLNQVIDILTPPDAVGVIRVLHAHVDTLRHYFMNDDVENRQRLLMARALSISMTIRLTGILKATIYHGEWALKMRYILLACVPPTFDGVANKHRGKDLPALTRKLAIYPVTRAEEDAFAAEFKEALNLRSALGLTPTSLTLTDFLLNVRVHRFLQDPTEYIAQTLLEGGLDGRPPGEYNEEELEEGEENEDLEDRAMKSRQKQAERHIHNLESADALWGCLDSTRQLIKLLQAKCQHEAECMEVDGGLLWSFSPLSPLAFIEALESLGPPTLVYVAQSIMVLLKIHLEWPLRADETSLLAKWSERINPQIIRIYKSLLQTIEQMTKALPPADTDAVRALLLHELDCVAQKYEGFKPFELEESTDAPESIDREDAVESERLKNIRSSGIPCLQQLSEVTDPLMFDGYDLTSKRSEELFVSSAVPEGLDKMPLAAKLRLRDRDYEERMAIDEDPSNDIECDERLVSHTLNQWRILRSSFLSGATDNQHRIFIPN